MKKIMYAALGMVLFASCNKEESFEAEKQAPDFEVTTEKATYTVDESVRFTIEGDPGVLDFWSGEAGNDYDYRNGRFSAGPDNKVKFSFMMRVHYPDRTGGKIFVLASTDFNGNRGSYESIIGATWTDITERCEIDHDAEVAAYVFSEPVDVTDLWEEGKPMYFAFKYEFNPEWGSIGKTIWVKDILVETVVEGDNFVFSGRTLSEDYPTFSTGSPSKHPEASDNTGSLLRMTSNTVGEFNGVSYTRNVPNEDYWVTPAYVGPDQPVRLTTVNRPTLTSRTHTYSEPGVYKVVFVGTDPSLRENNQTLREIEITIVPKD